MLRAAPHPALSVTPISVVPLHASHCHTHRLSAAVIATASVHRQCLSRSITLYCANSHQRCNLPNASAAGFAMATEAPLVGVEAGPQVVTGNSQVAANVNGLPKPSDLAPAATPAEAATAAAEIPGLQPSTAAGAAGTVTAGLDGCASQQPQMAPAASSAQASATTEIVASAGAPTTSEPPAAAGADAAATTNPASAGSDVDASPAPATNAELDTRAAASVSPAARRNGAAENEDGQGPPISKNQMKKRAKLQRCVCYTMQVMQPMKAQAARFVRSL